MSNLSQKILSLYCIITIEIITNYSIIKIKVLFRGKLMIKVENITKRFKNRTVLKSISFQIEKCEFVSIIGPGGCGKTTLLKMINRLIKPTSGKMLNKTYNIRIKLNTI